MDRYLEKVLEAYFEEAKKDDNIEVVEIFKNGKEVPVKNNEKEALEEGKLDTATDAIDKIAGLIYSEKQIKKDSEELVQMFKDAQKQHKYKYWCVRMVTFRRPDNSPQYKNYPSYSDFYLYGSNVKPFTDRDRGFLKAWKSRMEAERVSRFRSYYLINIKDVPRYVMQYML